MRRQLGPAARGEGAGIRLRAMLARGHAGERPREHAGQRVDLAGHAAEQRLDHLRHVGADEQVAQVRVRAGPVEVHHLQPADVEAAPSRHVGLNGDVEQVRLPHAGRGLDLGQAEAIPLALEDVHRHEDTVRAEGRLVHGRRALRERLPRRGQPLLVGVVGQVDQHAAGHVRPGQCPDAAPLIENGPALWVDLELGRGRLMRHPPQELVALQPLQRAGLRQTDRHIVRSQRSYGQDIARSMGEALAGAGFAIREGVGSRAGAVLWWLAPVHPMARLSLTLFGGFRARLDPDQALVIAIKKSQALLAYLALPLGQAHPRDKLAALLWGDMQEAQARAGLRQTLYTLRKVLGDPEPLRLVGETVALEPALVAADVQAFEQGVARGTQGSPRGGGGPLPGRPPRGAHAARAALRGVAARRAAAAARAGPGCACEAPHASSGTQARSTRPCRPLCGWWPSTPSRNPCTGRSCACTRSSAGAGPLSASTRSVWRRSSASCEPNPMTRRGRCTSKS